MSRPPRARNAVLDAAERVLLRQGAPALTLDAIAAEAGVSKGGLMYHFPTKEALLGALVVRAVDIFDAALAEAARSDVPGEFTRAYLRTTIPAEPGLPIEHEDEQAPPDLIAALAAAASQDGDLLTPLREAYARWQDRLEHDGLPAGAATAVRLAVDGWWLASLLDLPALSRSVHEQTLALLLGLTRPAG
jgi:AcrR family transcriptional regulator